jgi:phage portal protein BeeE
VHIYRDVDGLPVEFKKPPIFVTPGGTHWKWKHWVWASQHGLDSSGNAVGIITERNALGLPSRIDLQPLRIVSIILPKGKTEPIYKIDNQEYSANQIWHERQFPVPGLPVGLSPIAHAALSIGEYLSEQQFALDWFGGGGVPKLSMRNKAKVLKPEEVMTAKQWYRDVIQNGDPLVMGNDWEFQLISGLNAGITWLEARKYGLADVCRFFGCPADLIDAMVMGGQGTITYQTTAQRNLQFLIMNMRPAVNWREDALSDLLPINRYAKLDTSVLLDLDPMTKSQLEHETIINRTATPTEVRRSRGLPPFTQEQKDEFIELFGVPSVKQLSQKVAGQDRPEEQHRDMYRDTLEDWMYGATPRSPVPIGEER